MEIKRGYLAYLLRLWETEGADGPVWRASLESPHTGERRAFATIESFFAFLLAEMDAARNEETEGGG